MATRKTRVQWSTIIGKFERSGQSHAAFCAARGLNIAGFRCWLYKLRRSDRGPAMLPVEVVAAPLSLGSEHTTVGGVVIVVAGLEVRVPVGTDTSYVAVLITELRRC